MPFNKIRWRNSERGRIGLQRDIGGKEWWALAIRNGKDWRRFVGPKREAWQKAHNWLKN